MNWIDVNRLGPVNGEWGDDGESDVSSVGEGMAMVVVPVVVGGLAGVPGEATTVSAGAAGRCGTAALRWCPASPPPSLQL